MAREFLLIYPEGNVPANWGVFPGGIPYYIQLTDSNAFTMRPAPVRWTIRSAGGYNRRVLSGSFKTMTTGALNNMVIFGSQVNLWQNWLTPYATSNPSVYDLPSCSIDHGIQMEDGSNTTIYKRYLGVKVAAWNITSNSDASLLRLSLTELIAKSWVNGTSVSDPAFSSYPGGGSDSPFVHQHASTITVNSSRTSFDTFTVNGRHLLDPRFFNSTTIAYLKYCGRDMDWSITFPYVLSTDRTSLFENTGTGFGVVPVTMNITYSIPGSARTLTMNFESNSLLGSVTDALDFNRLFMQNITGWSQVDYSALTDFAISVT